MNFIIPLLIITLMAIPAYAANKQTAKPMAYPIKQKQTIVVHNKQLTQKQLKEVKQAVKEKKCKSAVDPKSKKKYYICN